MYIIRDDVNLKELKKYGFEEKYWGYIYYPNKISAISIDNDGILFFKVERNMDMYYTELELLGSDIEDIKNSYIAFEQKVRELTQANLVVEWED